MARIRSVHPGIFTDEAFASLPVRARILLIGIWTESDDHGVFEWKPLGLKMRIFPADAVTNDDMVEMLGDLSAADCITEFKSDDKAYGAVRNFCKWQRPKKPTYRYPLPEQYRTYVGAGYNHSRTSPPDEGCTVKVVGGKVNSNTKTESLERVPPATNQAPPAAATLSPKPASQSRKGLAALGTPLPSDWIPDDPTCARVKTDFGMTDEDLRTELPAFHALNVQGGVLSADWTATFYLFCKRWKEHRDKQAAPRLELNRKAAEPAKQPEQFTEADWDSVVGMYARTGRWSRQAGNDPTSPACLAPRAILEKHGINLQTGERTIPPRKVAAS